MLKKRLGLIACFVVIVGVFFLTLFSSNEKELIIIVENDNTTLKYICNYNEDQSINILSCSGNDVSIYVPNELNGHKVKEIASFCFDCQNINSIEISEVILNDFAFYNCGSVESLVLNCNVDYTNAFGNLNNVNSIVFQGKGKLIDYQDENNFISKLNNLQSVYIDDEIEMLGDYYFANAFNLKNVYLSNKITDINQACFKNCTSLERINLDNIVTINKEAFTNCLNLKQVYLPSSITFIDDTAFSQLDFYVLKNSYAQKYLDNKQFNYQTIELKTNVETIECNLKDTYKIQLVDYPEFLMDGITYSSSNDIIQVDKDGRVYCNRTGQSVITVSNGQVNTSVIFYVNYKNDNEEYCYQRMDVNSQFTIDLKKYDLEEIKNITTSNNKVVSINSDNTLCSNSTSGTSLIKVSDSNKTINIVLEVRQMIESLTANKYINLVYGENRKIDVNIAPKNADTNALVFTSSDPSILTVDSLGNIKAKKAGVCDVYVSTTDGSSITVTVPVAISKQKFKTNVTVVPLMVNKPFYLLCKSVNNNQVKYTSYNNNVATVDNNGVIKGINNGETVILLDSLDNNYHKFVNVKCYDNATALGIDISNYQSYLKAKDFINFKNKGIDFVYLRCLYHTAIDKSFERNIKYAIDAGLDVSVYIYSTATTVQSANQEASVLIDLLKKRPLQYPVMLDIETDAQLKLSKKAISDIVNVFYQKLKDEGYQMVIYSNYYRLNNISSGDYGYYPANWDVLKPTGMKKEYKMWQFTDSGYLDKKYYHYDMSLAFFDYPTYYKENHLNNN